MFSKMLVPRNVQFKLVMIRIKWLLGASSGILYVLGSPKKLNLDLVKFGMLVLDKNWVIYKFFVPPLTAPLQSIVGNLTIQYIFFPKKLTKPAYNHLFETFHPPSTYSIHRQYFFFLYEFVRFL